jgi:hypothetical protein
MIIIIVTTVETSNLTWEDVFSLWSVPRDYLENNWGDPSS